MVILSIKTGGSAFMGLFRLLLVTLFLGMTTGCVVYYTKDFKIIEGQDAVVKDWHMMPQVYVAVGSGYYSYYGVEIDNVDTFDIEFEFYRPDHADPDTITINSVVYKTEEVAIVIDSVSVVFPNGEARLLRVKHKLNRGLVGQPNEVFSDTLWEKPGYVVRSEYVKVTIPNEVQEIHLMFTLAVINRNSLTPLDSDFFKLRMKRREFGFPFFILY